MRVVIEDFAPERRLAVFGMACRHLLRVSALVAWLLPAALHADEIILKNGKIIQGDSRVTGSRVVIQPWDSDVSIVLDRSRIETIIPADGPVPAPSQPAAAGEGVPSASIAEEERDAANTPLSRPSNPPSPYNPAIPRVEFSLDSQLDAQVRATLDQVFPRIMAFCVRDLEMSLPDEIPLNIQIFDDLASFEEHKALNSDIHYAVEAYYAVKEDKIFIWKNRFDQNVLANIYHEGTHAILRRELNSVPSWIDEGLAEYFEGIHLQGGTVLVLSPPNNDGWAKRFLLEGRMTPLHDFLRMSNYQWRQMDETTRSLPRIMAWSLVSYLMTQEQGRHALKRYLQALKRTTPGESLLTAFQELNAAYPGGVAALDRGWRSWILEDRKAQTL